MKKLFIFPMLIFVQIIVLAQSPQKISYQAVIRNINSELIINQPVGIRISILQDSAIGSEVYREIFNPNPQTNSNGLLSIEIGTGIILTGNFSLIDWANGIYFIKTEIDPTGGTNYTINGTTQILSVPYALHAKTAESITGTITESDPIYFASPSSNITNTNIISWDSSYSWGNHFGLYKSISWMPQWNDITEKPIFANVAISGNYNDLSNKPSFIDSLRNNSVLLSGNQTIFGNKTFNNKIVINQQGTLNDTTISSAAFEINTTSQGFLLPRLTNEQMNTINNPVEGLSIYNKTLKKQCFYNGSGWICYPTDCYAIQSFAGNDTNIIDTNFLMLNANFPNTEQGHWYIVSGIGGSFSNDTVHNTIFTGQYNTQYTLRWVISNPPCTSSYDDVNISFSNWNGCGTPLYAVHNAGDVAPVFKTVSYGTVSTSLFGGTKCAITQNLGAESQAISAVDSSEASRGWYWQFNRKQGFKHDGTTRTPNTAWISTIDDPCRLLLGSTWRILTKTEWSNANTNGNWNCYFQPYSSVLKLHNAGGLNYITGNLEWVSNHSRFWSSTQYHNTRGYSVRYYETSGGDNDDIKSFGTSIRCLKD